MKIVVLHTDFRIYWPARLNALRVALEKRGDSLDVIEIAGLGSPYSFSDNKCESNSFWHILFPEEKPENLLGNTIKSKLFELLDRLNPDVIVSGAIAFPSGALSVQWGLKHKRKVIIFDDARLDAVPRSRIVNFIKKSVYSAVDGMFYPASDWIATGEFWGFDKSQMAFGVDVVNNEFWSNHTNQNPGLGSYFVSVGRQIPKKNFIGILQAYKRYVSQLGKEQAYNMLLIGDGEQHDEIVDFVEINGLKDKVVLLPFLSQEELRSIYQHATALCCNSDNTETWGLVINEAMACGCPVFATHQCGATSSLVRDGVNGYSFNCNDICQLSEIMERFTKLRASEQIKMGEASKSIIKEWGLPKFVDGCIEIIDRVSNRAKRKTSLISKIICYNWNGRYNPV